MAFKKPSRDWLAVRKGLGVWSLLAFWVAFMDSLQRVVRRVSTKVETLGRGVSGVPRL